MRCLLQWYSVLVPMQRKMLILLQKQNHSRLPETAVCVKVVSREAAMIEGVSKASWDSKTQLLVVTYAPSKTSTQKIEEKVAAVWS